MGRTAESQVAHPSPHQGSADQFRVLVVERRLPGVLLQPQQSPADPGDIQPIDLFASINPVFGKDIYTGTIVVNEETEKLKLSSRQSQEYDVWSMQYVPQTIDGKPYKLAELASVEKGQMPQKVCKVNQQYRLCLQYEYIGASNQGNKIQERDLKEINAILPMGYTAKSESAYWYWDKKDNKQYLLLLLIIVIIFFTTSILFNSLKQPLAVIFVIPISYIGVFLTFYWFKLNFDQGGFAPSSCCAA